MSLPLLAAVTAVLLAQTPTTPPPPTYEIPTAVTHHVLDVTSGHFNYTATAEQIALKNDEGTVECRMFCVGYTKDGADPLTRPVTFAFNGGPGSATLWLHLGALGPKRAPMNDDGSLPKPPYHALDNNETWLDFTDVVVIDAPACGLSRLLKPEYASKYFGLNPDIQAFTTFIHNWLTIHNRWSSPLFVAGESYGGIRGSGLSDSLFQNGIALDGFISISGSSNFMTLDGMRGNDLPYIGFLPSLAACAWYHHKLSPRFKDVASLVTETQNWIDKEYGPALLRGDSLSPAEKEHIAEKLSEYIGLKKEYCLGANLRVNDYQFFTELLREDGLMIGRYDGRLVGKQEFKVSGGGGDDPSDEAVNAPFTASINNYLLNDLQVKTDLPYLNYGNLTQWNMGDGGYPETASRLRNVLTRNQHFHVLYCCGYFDLACPLNATKYTVNHMGLDPESLSHVSYQYFPAGHMMYIEKSSREKLHNDVKQFETECLAAK